MYLVLKAQDQLEFSVVGETEQIFLILLDLPPQPGWQNSYVFINVILSRGR